MKCSICANPMALLFLSSYCPHCEAKAKEPEKASYKHIGYAKSIYAITDHKLAGKRGVVYETAEEAKYSYTIKVGSNSPIVYKKEFYYLIHPGESVVSPQSVFIIEEVLP